MRSLFVAPTLSLLAATLFCAVPLPGQQSKPLTPGQVAPDFALTGATQYGVLRDPVRLGDFRGETVVIAFFYKARSGG
ncbi:MAG: hypothetical protein ACREMO_00755 [Gemmatimonadales bacterium]